MQISSFFSSNLTLEFGDILVYTKVSFWPKNLQTLYPELIDPVKAFNWMVAWPELLVIVCFQWAQWSLLIE